MKLIALAAALVIGGNVCSIAAQSVTDLRCEDLIDPIGIDVVQPRLSWRSESGVNGAAQRAYQVLVATSPDLLKEGFADLWDSDKVITSQSQHIIYAGKSLLRGIPHYWTVRIWNEKGDASSWSRPAFWTFFDLHSDKGWQAKWITDGSSSPWLRQSVELTTPPARAYIYVNALGYFQLFINGRRVGNDEFAPHVGQYNKRTFCITYDVTDYLQKGRNTVGIWMGSGWNQKGAGVNVPPTVRVQLEIQGDDGAMEPVLVTDGNWRTKASSHAHRGKWQWNNFGGEIYDGSLDQPGWADIGFDDSSWQKAQVASMPDRPVSAEMLQRNRVIETITPVEVTRLGAGDWLVDMGKAITGTIEATFSKAEKARLSTRYHRSRIPERTQLCERKSRDRLRDDPQQLEA